MMKKYLYFVFAVSVSLKESFALTSDELKQALIPENDSAINAAAGNVDENLIDRILGFMRDGIFELLFILALIIFLYIAFKLIVARGNPEEFKKALQSFIYAALWLFIIAFAWALVRLVAGITI